LRHFASGYPIKAKGKKSAFTNMLGFAESEPAEKQFLTFHSPG
jgi:hypothetical protein